MRYLSLFSGIGGFEVAIHQVYGNTAECVGYSEIDKHALAEYERHYPNHTNIGDVTKIKKKDIEALGNIDIVIGGFPCSDLSSVNYKDRKGLDGEKSGLFWTMLKILKWARSTNPGLQIIIENNASMAHRWRDIISNELTKVFKQPVYCNYFDSSQWVMQRRRRYYWTITKIPIYNGPRLHTMKDVLVPVYKAIKYVLSERAVEYMNASPKHLQFNSGKIMHNSDDCYTLVDVPYATRLSSGKGSSSKNDFIRCVDTRLQNAFILDYRLCKGKHTFLPRYLTIEEINNIFGFPENYVFDTRSSVYLKLYGMTVTPPVIKHILITMKDNP